MATLGRGDLVRMALRSELLQATWNYERQQGLGWAWAMQPALERLEPDAARRRERLAEHTGYFNTQPTLASFALGAAAALEEERAAGHGPDDRGMERIKAVLGAALAAVGDKLFWFTLRPLAACVGVLFALGGSWWGALALWLCYNAVHQPVRLLGVAWGYHGGSAVMNGTVRAPFQRLAYLFGLAGSALIGVLIAVLLVPGGAPRSFLFQAMFAVGLGFGLLSAQRARPSPTQWAFVLGVLATVAVWTR